MTDSEYLEAQIENRKWMRISWPFPHVRADHVLRQEIYSKVEESFLELLYASSSGAAGQRGFAKTIPDYDAHIAKIPSDGDNPMQLFQSRAWCDLIAGLFKVTFTGDVNAELHHHGVGSASGRIHNDLNPGWFAGQASASTTNLADNRRCGYKFGSCKEPGVEPRQTVRAVAMLYYLANPPWRRGDGGETAMYESLSDSLENPAARVPPSNNSLVAFECTPFSFHTFLANRRSERNSIVLWVHRPYEEVTERWGKDAVVPWSSRKKTGRR